MYVCIYVWTMYVLRIYELSTNMYCMYVCMYVRMHVCMCVLMRVCMYVCMYVCMHVCMYVYITLGYTWVRVHYQICM